MADTVTESGHIVLGTGAGALLAKHLNEGPGIPEPDPPHIEGITEKTHAAATELTGTEADTLGASEAVTAGAAVGATLGTEAFAADIFIALAGI